MVKNAKTTGPRPAVNKDGSRRKKPGPTAQPDMAKTERLALRVHPDLIDILTARSRERGISRSQYVEKLLIGWANYDPRNPRLDLNGRAVVPAPDARAKSSLGYLKRWQTFARMSQLLLGASPPREWIEPDPDDGWYDETLVDPDVHRKPAVDDVDQPLPPRWRKPTTK
jgi:hypothetical protein